MASGRPYSVENMLEDLERAPKKRRKGCINPSNEFLVDELVKLMNESSSRHADHLKHSYARAIASIKKYPLQIKSGSDAKELRGVGDFLANKVQMILVNQGLQNRDLPIQALSQTPAVKATESKLYVPSYEKAPWYVMMTLWVLKAVSALSAISETQLELEMALLGFSEGREKILSVLPKLISQHKVVSRTNGEARLLLLTDRGVNSATSISLSKKFKTWFNRKGLHSVSHICRSSPLPSNSTKFITMHKKGTSMSNKAGSPGIILHDKCPILGDREKNDGLKKVTLSPSAYSQTAKKTSKRIKGVQPYSNSKSMQHNPRNSSQPITSPSHDIEEVPGVSTAFASLITSNVCQSSPTAFQSPDQIAQEADKWEVVLILDHRETVCRRDSSAIFAKILEHGVKCEQRALNIGDMLWVARRHRISNDGKTVVEDFVLDSIVERKTIEDLCVSIVDKRFVEQKDRLEKCGLENVIYLVEGSKASQTSTRSLSVTTAIAMTSVHHNFLVQSCSTIDETILFLVSVHKQLLNKIPVNRRWNSRFENLTSNNYDIFDPWEFLPARCSTYERFNTEFQKRQKVTVGEYYKMMLMQVKGISSTRALAIAERFPTFRHQYNEYKSLTNQNLQDSLVADIVAGGYKRRIGPACSTNLSRVFNSTF